MRCLIRGWWKLAWVVSMLVVPTGVHADVDGDCVGELALARNTDQNFRAQFWSLRSGSPEAIFETGSLWGEDNFATSVAFGDIEGDGVEEFAIARRTDVNQGVQIRRWDPEEENFRSAASFVVGSTWDSQHFATM